VAEGAPLLREYRVKSLIEGSNPSLSARHKNAPERGFFCVWRRSSPTKKPAGAGFFITACNGNYFGRGDRIRTCDFYVPNVALYQAELHPDSEPRMLMGGQGLGNRSDGEAARTAPRGGGGPFW
jgi:hypothetical protein